VRNGYKILVGDHEGRKPLGKSRHRWEDRIKIISQDLSDLGYGPAAGSCGNYNDIKKGLSWLAERRRILHHGIV
jgi:hypothetical protein